MQADAWWILRVKLQVSNAHTENARTHIPYPSLLMQNARSPEPHTQFSTLLWACAVNPAARRGNRQHLSPASRWRNAPHAAVGVTARSRARLHNAQILFSVKFGEKKHWRSKFPLALWHTVFVPFSGKASVGVPKQQTVLMFRGGASCQWAQELRHAGDAEFLQDIITHWSPAQKMT